MHFNPNNAIIQLCIQGMAMEAKDQQKEANRLFSQAWNEAKNDFEKFIAAYFLARQQKRASDRLKWYETALQFALRIDDDAMKSAYPSLYSNIARSCEELGDANKAKVNYGLASSYLGTPSDKGPFYHGTRADLQIGDLLTAGRFSNYKAEFLMNHIYFTALVNGAGLAAGLAKGDGPERIYIVEPTGPFENDPNVTDKKFPGNLTRSYRARKPLKIIGKITEWQRQTPAELEKWREKLADHKGEIIN